MTFDAVLRKLRKDRGATQAEVARAAGVTRRTYVSYENGKTVPRNQRIYAALSSYFGCDLTQFVFTTAEANVNQTEHFVCESADGHKWYLVERWSDDGAGYC